MGIPSLRDASLASALATRICRRCQAQILHELSGVIESSAIAACSDGGDRHGQLHATAGLARCHDGREPPGGDLFVECLVKTLEPVRYAAVTARTYAWKTSGWCGGGPDDRAEPAPGRWAPGGPTGQSGYHAAAETLSGEIWPS